MIGRRAALFSPQAWALAAACCSAIGQLGATQVATSPPGPRVAALGWACAQTLLALGVVPLVVPEIERYGRLVVEPAIPSSVQEIGLRSEPNLELLQSFAPDIIIIDPSITAAIPRLKLIAPVEVFTIFKSGRHPLETARSSTMELAQRVGVQAACEAYLARFDAAMTGYREQLGNRGGKPLYLVSEIARNRALVFGPEQPLSGGAEPVRTEERLDRTKRPVGTYQCGP